MDFIQKFYFNFINIILYFKDLKRCKNTAFHSILGKGTLIPNYYTRLYANKRCVRYILLNQ